MPEILSDSVKIEFSNQSLNKEGAKIECQKCFSMKYCSLFQAVGLHTVNDFFVNTNVRQWSLFVTSCLFYLSFNSDFYVSKIMRL